MDKEKSKVDINEEEKGNEEMKTCTDQMLSNRYDNRNSFYSSFYSTQSANSPI